MSIGSKIKSGGNGVCNYLVLFHFYLFGQRGDKDRRKREKESYGLKINIERLD